MNPFTQHPQQQGISYREHLGFAMGIAWRLFIRAVAFALHAIFPFIGIKPALDLEATAGFIQEHNEWIEKMKRNMPSISGDTPPGRQQLPSQGNILFNKGPGSQDGIMPNARQVP